MTNTRGGSANLRGFILHESNHCITVEKQYPGGAKGGVTYRKCDVSISRDGEHALLNPLSQDQAEIARRLIAAKLRPKQPQEPMDIGLFSDVKNQLKLV